MIHYGDVRKINGAYMPKVDVITFGAPCQDLSVAGKRAGMKNVLMGDDETTRSGLFFEAIRIIKEMRQDDRKNGIANDAIKPRYAVYENVPGAFSSNKGEDFRAVLEETAKIADQGAVIPGPPKGKWTPAGCIMGDGWSIAWRVHDAQFWGVPQRRKRICLLADFNGDSAGKILFELRREATKRDFKPVVTDSRAETRSEVQLVSEGVQGDTGQGETAGEETAGVTGSGSCISSYGFKPKQGVKAHGMGYEEETAPTLDATANQGVLVLNDQGGRQMSVSVGITGTLRGEEHGHQPIVFEPETTSMVSGSDHKEPQVVCLEGNGSRPSHKGDGWHDGDPMYTLNATEHHAVAYRGDAITSPVNSSNPQPGDPCHTLTDDSRNYVVLENHSMDSRIKISESDTVQTLCARMGTGGGNVPMVMQEPYNATTGSFMKAGNSGIAETLMARDYKDPQIVCDFVVRRLTPTECERLQGFPDYWTDICDWVDSKGKKHKGNADSPRYKALGNSIALPFWEWMARRMRKRLGDNPLMGSLFSGIGGFELVYMRAGVTPAWASEIDEFAITVTKARFAD